MKKTAKILAVILVLALVLSLGACSKKATIDGSWIYKMNFMDAMNAAGEDDMGEEFGQFADQMKEALKDVSVDVKLDLGTDGKYTVGVTEESAKAAVPKMIDAMKSILPDVMKAMLGDDYESSMAEAGMSMDDLMESFMGEMDADEMAKELYEGSEKGTYKFENGKLSFTPEEGDPYEWTAELSGSELKVTEFSGDFEMSDALKGLLPLVFKK